MLDIELATDEVLVVLADGRDCIERTDGLLIRSTVLSLPVSDRSSTHLGTTIVLLGSGGSGLASPFWFDGFFEKLSLTLGRCTSTQSGSLVSFHGLLGLRGFGTMPFPGGATVDLTDLLPSSHHFRRSELAGGNWPYAVDS